MTESWKKKVARKALKSHHHQDLLNSSLSRKDTVTLGFPNTLPLLINCKKQSLE